MLALGAVGLTTYQRSQLRETHAQAFKDAKRAECRLHVSAKNVELDAEESTEKELDGPSMQFSMELLNGCLGLFPSIMNSELVRLNWANRSILRGRVALLNIRSPYLDQLLKRAAGEELAGFALYGTTSPLYGTGHDPLTYTEAVDLQKRVEDALHEANADPIPIWWVYGSGAQDIAQANPVCIHSVEEEPFPTDQYFLPGGKEGMYELAWLSDSVAFSSAQFANQVTGVFDSISEPLSRWTLSLGSINSAHMKEMDNGWTSYLSSISSLQIYNSKYPSFAAIAEDMYQTRDTHCVRAQ